MTRSHSTLVSTSGGYILRCTDCGVHWRCGNHQSDDDVGCHGKCMAGEASWELVMDNKITDYDLAVLLVFSFRYALGRMTYAPSMVQDLIKKYVHTLSYTDMETMIRDIDSKYPSRMDESDSSIETTDDMDRRGWREFRSFLLGHIRTGPEK